LHIPDKCDLTAYVGPRRTFPEPSVLEETTDSGFTAVAYQRILITRHLICIGNG